MAIRTLDPVFWDDESIALLSRDARLLFICMVTDPSLTDDFGVLPGNARTLRKHAFAFDDDVTPEQVEGWRNEMVTKCPNVVLFEVDGKPWLWLRNFQKFQNLRYHRKTTYPNPPDISELSRKLPELCNNFPMSSVVLSSVVLSSVEQGGTEHARKKTRAPAPPLPPQIVAFREAAGGTLLPRKATWPAIIRAVPDGEASLATWREVVTAWMCTPYSPQNINGMIDWFNNGIPKSMPRKAGNNGNHQRRVEVCEPPTYSETCATRARLGLPAITEAEYERLG
jgi:hypothetical protein